MNRMASLRQGIRGSLSSCTGSTLRAAKSTRSAGHQAPPPSIGAKGSQTCGPNVNGSAPRSAFSPPRDSATSAPFASKCSSSTSIPGARCYSLQIARLPGEVAAIQSLMPYYTATANSRLVSRLGTNGDAPILQDDDDGT